MNGDTSSSGSSGTGVTPRNGSVTWLAGVGGGCLAAIVGMVLGALVGFILGRLMVPPFVMRTTGEEALADQIQAGADFIKRMFIVALGALIGGAGFGIFGLVWGINRAKGPPKASPAFPVDQSGERPVKDSGEA